VLRIGQPSVECAIAQIIPDDFKECLARSDYLSIE
jgi:hypothetical protein